MSDGGTRDDDPFGAALKAAAARIAPDTRGDPAANITLSVSTLQATGEPFRRLNYQDAYNADGLATLQDLTSRAEAIYQQTHVLAEALGHLIATTADPPVRVGGLAGVLDTIAATSHPLGAPLHQVRREARLVRWLNTVRNKAVQHRVQNGYTNNNAIVAPDGFVLIRKPHPPDDPTARKARATLTGFNRSFGVQLDSGEGSDEALAYLDLASHSIYRTHPGQADPAREIVEAARVHQVVMSSAVLDNIAWAVTGLISATPVLEP
jgi:hypothetical protein